MHKIDLYIELKDKLIIGSALISNVYKDEIVIGNHFIDEYDFSLVRAYSDIDDDKGRELTDKEKDYIYEYIIEKETNRERE